MLRASVIGLAVLALASLGFFFWCWLHFRDESESHPIYRADQLSCSVTGAQSSPKLLRSVLLLSLGQDSAKCHKSAHIWRKHLC
jgi:hypothetical protein